MNNCNRSRPRFRDQIKRYALISIEWAFDHFVVSSGRIGKDFDAQLGWPLQMTFRLFAADDHQIGPDHVLFANDPVQISIDPTGHRPICI